MKNLLTMLVLVTIGGVSQGQTIVPMVSYMEPKLDDRDDSVTVRPDFMTVIPHIFPPFMAQTQTYPKFIVVVPSRPDVAVFEGIRGGQWPSFALGCPKLENGWQDIPRLNISTADWDKNTAQWALDEGYVNVVGDIYCDGQVKWVKIVVKFSELAGPSLFRQLALFDVGFLIAGLLIPDRTDGKKERLLFTSWNRVIATRSRQAFLTEFPDARVLSLDEALALATDGIGPNLLGAPGEWHNLIKQDCSPPKIDHEGERIWKAKASGRPEEGVSDEFACKANPPPAGLLVISRTCKADGSVSFLTNDSACKINVPMIKKHLNDYFSDHCVEAVVQENQSNWITDWCSAGNDKDRIRFGQACAFHDYCLSMPWELGAKKQPFPSNPNEFCGKEFAKAARDSACNESDRECNDNANILGNLAAGWIFPYLEAQKHRANYPVTACAN